MGKKIIFSVSVFFIILIALGIWVGSWLVSRWQPVNPSGPSPYTAVYMITGDIYFGKFSRFPKPHMTDVWFLQRGTTQNNQQQFGVLPFASAFWGPVSTVYFNENQILFWASLRNDSQVVKALQNPTSIPQGAEVAPPAAGLAPQENSFHGPSSPPPGSQQ
ncbi:MAG: hypothetical protein A3B25_02380 [Candidatus Ryanbacteria bacterium RIFCSPLOWO2_01_FULL_48_26]|uniref:Uncharacterized protein n=1 Tax=Candidatus Ryanbacteria bacterium RIFCSPLOWO2_01_FULL_48_26 TaxID=1802126 RepID=A0A1G2GQP8_9BACT|nr:MAG: hypothetical protein A3B25_02380 [Candidatus Ryanbacteria bacterium RIFCSPLOWO2_01_FULL_48_26]